MDSKDELRFELRHLRYFIVTAELGGIRRAARYLGVDAGAVSRRIRDLEDQIGAAIFIRGQGGVRLTYAGERFLLRARRAVEQLSRGKSDVREIGRGQQGVVRIGISSSISSGFLAELMSIFNDEHSDVRLEYVEGGPQDHVPAIQQHRLDLAFVGGFPVAESCELIHLWSERIYVAMSEKDELGGLQEIAWWNLRGRHFVVTEAQPGPDVQEYLIKNMMEPGYAPAIDRHAVYRDTLMQIVANGNFLTVTTEARIVPPFLGVIYRPLAGQVLAFSALWSPKNDNPAFRRLLSLARTLSGRWGAFATSGTGFGRDEASQSRDLSQ